LYNYRYGVCDPSNCNGSSSTGMEASVFAPLGMYIFVSFFFDEAGPK